MTAAAISKDLLMIDKGNNVESQGCMAGFAHIPTGDVIARFAADGSEIIVVTVHTT